VSLLPARPSPLAPGFKLDRYELLCPIAEGGMASVWIARHTGKHGFEKFVAIKTVLPKYASDARFQQMFQDEARIASRIEHPNVAQILDVGEQHDITYLVMEYVDGESLSTMHRTLAKKSMRIPHGVVLRVMADVCGGLHTAHELREPDGELLGVVHRDVSPQNVLVSTKGNAKLIDFGIAKARDRVVGDTSSGQVKGKIRYMAPEQALGSTLDRRADIWAVGAVLYHLLSGKPPYDGDNDVQTLMVLTSGRPPVPLPPEIHPSIAAAVKRALTADMTARFATAADLQQALEDAIVEAKIVTNSTTVAAFLAEHVAERSKKRRDAIAVGVKAAAERDRYAEIMRSNVKVTAGGLAPTGGHRLSEAPGPGSYSGVGTRSGVGPLPPGALALADSPSREGLGPGSASGSGSASGAGSTGLSGGTLGLAAMDVGGGGPLRSRVFAVASASAGAVLGIAGLILLLTRHSGDRAEPVDQADHGDRQTAKVIAEPPPPVASTIPEPETVATGTPWAAAPGVAPAASAADTNPTGSAEPPTIPATSLRPVAPVYPAAGFGAAPPWGMHPPVRPAAAAAPKPNHTKTRVDDGF
jgi:hypothetical protein